MQEELQMINSPFLTVLKSKQDTKTSIKCSNKARISPMKRRRQVVLKVDQEIKIRRMLRLINQNLLVNSKDRNQLSPRKKRRHAVILHSLKRKKAKIVFPTNVKQSSTKKPAVNLRFLEVMV